MDTIHITMYVQSLTNITCRLWMMRGDTLLILGHGVIIKSRSTLPPCEGMPCLALSSYSLNMVTTLHRCAPVILVGAYIRGP